MRVVTLCVAAALAAAPRPAGAQTGPGGDIDLQAFRPAMDSRGFITVNSSDVLGHGELSFGLVTSWGRNLLRFEAGDNAYAVTHLLSPTLVGAVGLRLAGLDFELGAAAPFSVMTGKREPDDLSPDDPNAVRRHEFDGQGLGDVAVHAKWRLRDAGRDRLGVALTGSLHLPTATAAQRWLGDGVLAPRAALVVDRQLGRVRTALSGGVRLRPGGPYRFRDDAALDPAGRPQPMTDQVIEVGTTLPVGAAASLALVPQRVALVAEVFGEVPLGGQNYLPLEALAGVKLYLAQSSYLTLGGGVGLAPSRGANPDSRAFVGIVFEPAARERGRGRIEIGERDLRIAQDDPPERDDGLLDLDEPCPDEPPEFDFELDFYQGLQGCPEYRPVAVGETELTIFENIYFEFDSAVIEPRSHPVLRAVARALRDNPDILQIEVQGHTDERGSDAYNLRLSQARAESVMEFLRGEGVAAGRVTAKGYGERVPLIRERSEAAWAKNRRVEFVILQRR